MRTHGGFGAAVVAVMFGGFGACDAPANAPEPRVVEPAEAMPKAPAVATATGPAAVAPAVPVERVANDAPVAKVTKPAERPKAAGPTLFGLELALEDQHGKPVTLAELGGDGPLLVSMFYASCTYACPTLIQDVARIERSLSPEARAKTRVLLVTFDPPKDTPEVMRGLVTTHALDGARWTFARAADDEGTRELAGALGITYRRLPDGNYNHSSVLVLLDAKGVPLAKLEGLRQDATAFTAVLEQVATTP